MIIKGFTDLFSKLRKYDFVKCLTLSEYSSLPEIIIRPVKDDIFTDLLAL